MQRLLSGGGDGGVDGGCDGDGGEDKRCQEDEEQHGDDASVAVREFVVHLCGRFFLSGRSLD